MSADADRVNGPLGLSVAGCVHLRPIMHSSLDHIPVDSDSEQLERIRTVARIMDDAVEIPVLGRVGLDPLIGLVPGAGDVFSAAVNGWIIVSAARLGASRAVLTRMLANAGIDALFGAVPFLGDLFDFVFKAHRKNLRLLEAHIANPGDTRRRSRRLLALTVASVMTLLVGLGALLGWGLMELVRAVLG